MFVRGLDYVLVVDRAAGLDHRFDARLRGLLDAVREREEGVRSHDRALGVFPLGVFVGLHRRQSNRVDAGDLPHPDADRLRAVGKEDAVGLDVFQGLPREDHRLEFRLGRLALGDDLEVVARDRLEVALLNQPPADEWFFGNTLGSIAEFADIEHA